MEKYKDLCRAFSENRRRFFDYYMTCGEMYHKVINGFKEYLDAPEDVMEFLPVEEEDRDSGTTYAAIGAMKLRDDGFWEVVICVTVYEQRNVRPWGRAMLVLLLKGEGDAYILKLDDNLFKITSLSDASVSQLYESMYAMLKRHYDGWLERVVQGNIERMPLGFELPPS